MHPYFEVHLNSDIDFTLFFLKNKIQKTYTHNQTKYEIYNCSTLLGNKLVIGKKPHSNF